jgi:hypothetical protein
MIVMKIFITFLLALNVVAPVAIIVSKDEPRMKKVAAWIFTALIVAGIVFAWII